MEINSEANCVDCPFYHHQEDADVLNTEPHRPIACAWGHCQRFPKWERKNPTTPACGEHPKYFRAKRSAYFVSKDGGWFDIRDWQQLFPGEELKKAQTDGFARLCKPGETIPIDDPIS